MRFGIVVFPGSNCDRDCYHVVERVLDEEAVWVWHRDEELPDLDGVILPGGFSYGDYLRTGAIAKMSPVMKAVRTFAERGGPVVGICNGFQVLLECEMLPGAMIRNNSLRFVCRDTHLRCEKTDTPVSSELEAGDVVKLPIAHAEGNFYIDEDGRKRLFDDDRVVFRYCDPDGEIHDEVNPNGSVHNIAGICNEGGNVVGMMPHPERASESLLGNADGRRVFESALKFAA